jgi:hypothetical protein
MSFWIANEACSMYKFGSASTSRYFFKPDLITLATDPFCLSHSATAASMFPVDSNP